MRHQWAILALSAVALVVPAFAQMHGGGSHGGGAMGGHSGISSSGSRGGISSAGSSLRAGGSLGVGSRSSASFNAGVHQGSFHSGSSFVGFHRPGFGPRRFGHRVFFGYSGGYYGYPGYYYNDFYPSSDYYPSYDYYGSAYNAAQNSIAQQQQDIDRLEDEVARLREQRESGQQETRDMPRPQAESAPTPTLLVFLDKHTQEVQNYGVVGDTLWIFTEQRATKLPLAWLDIDATIKANEDRGVDFLVPK
jgi:hypothetical protein